MKNKVYPNLEHLRHQVNLVSKAINELADMEIQPIKALFNKSTPKIEVVHCPGTSKLKSVGSGQKHQDGILYFTRSSIVCDCEVVWYETKNG